MRIFVTVGNSAEPFSRLASMVEDALSSLNAPFEGIFQAGTTSRDIRGIERVDYLSRPGFKKEMHRADVVICHAGVGTIHTALTTGHMPVVIPRLASHGECVNDHQLEIVRQLEARNLVRAPQSVTELRATIAGDHGSLATPEAKAPDLAMLVPLADAVASAKTGNNVATWRRLRRLARFVPSPRRLF